MAEHNQTGKDGEELARQWLIAQGFQILHQNWRFKQYEIDIIASKNNFLHFVEVKCRNWSTLGHPEDSVTKKKFKSLKRAADEYLQLNKGHRWIQYDILSITLHTQGKVDYFFLEDVFM